MSFYSFAKVIANTICQELEVADQLMNRLDKQDAQEVVGIFALNHVIRKPLLEALAARTIQIFLEAE